MNKIFVHPNSTLPKTAQFFRHPIFNLLGVRDVIAEHTVHEEEALRKWARGCQTIVEIGVAEGGSARALREIIQPTSNLYLIDPYSPGRINGINFTKLVAHRYVNALKRANVFWIQKFSFDAVKEWNKAIDFLYIDGDHTYEGCLKDWNDWNRFVTKRGIVAFHDARLFKDGWTEPQWGSVRLVNKLFRDTTSTGWEIVDEVDSLVIIQKH